MSHMATREFVSVLVPLLNEEESVSHLVDAVRDALAGLAGWELILVDDGSTDRTRDIVALIAGDDPRVRMVALARNYGQSTAMQAGFDHARGEVVVTMDGDLQNDPRDIPMLLEKLSEGYDLVAGYRIRRQDKFVTRKIPSWIANRIIRWITGVPIRDNGCSLKAYRKELLGGMRLYSEMHRFIPALAASTGGARIAEVGVRHHPRVHGHSKYGLARIFRVLADLLTIKMIRSFRLRPLLMFASLAGSSVFVGLLFISAALIANFSFRPMKALSVVFPAIALLWLALAAFLLMLGLVGEVVIRQQWGGGPNTLPLVREGEIG
jgi:glycosyltransferase involved in cell wall biosynthesis